MKNLILITICLLPLFVLGQEAEGEIVFEEKINMHMRLSGKSEEFKHMIPEFQSAKMVLYFNPTTSLYKSLPQDESNDFEHSSEDGNVQMHIKMDRPEDILYKNIAEDTKVEQKEFMGKKFLIKGETESYDWKMGSEQKEIQGYICQKAIYEDSTKTVEAWFTPQIPLASGPGAYGQLPGMILEVNIDKGARIVTASEVSFKKMPKNTFQKPTKGKAVSTDEFAAIVKKKMEEMGATSGKGGAIMILEERH